LAKLAIVYFSATGTTARLAGEIRAGATELADATLCQIRGDDIVSGRFRNEDLLRVIDEADAVAFGSPTFMGGPAAEFKAFADATSDRWSEQRWAGKIAAGFTTGSCPNGDQSHTLTYFTVLAAQHGMLWCGLDIAGGSDASQRNRLGCQTGLVTHATDGTLPAADLESARYLGQRLALTARRLKT